MSDNCQAIIKGMIALACEAQRHARGRADIAVEMPADRLHSLHIAFTGIFAPLTVERLLIAGVSFSAKPVDPTDGMRSLSHWGLFA